MTLEEATRVAAVVEIADMRCPDCVDELCDELNKSQLGFVWVRDLRDGTVTASPSES